MNRATHDEERRELPTLRALVVSIVVVWELLLMTLALG